MKTLSFLWTCLFMSLTLMVSAQGTTKSSLNGKVLDTSGEPLIGATVYAVHKPSGTTYGSATNLEGFYNMPNMRVGGPYEISFSYTGYEELVQDGIYLSLGQSFELDAMLSETAIELEGVNIVYDRNDLFDGNADGQKTVVDERTINDIPTISRSIGDFARFNPLANIEEGGDGFEISLAGQNNRFNTIYIDGAVNNDVFGLAGSGTNGGQTGVSPISLDAVEQFSIAVAPFDIRQSGFAGGAINAVTRSGTNEMEGSAYYFVRNNTLTGTQPAGREPEAIAPFTAKTYGARLGGPLIKNKLFFFVNAEIQRDETPQPFDVSTYNGDLSPEGIETLRSTLIDQYGYNPGAYDNNIAKLDAGFFLGKLDWNINEKHKLSLRHSYRRADNVEARRSSPFGINFINGSESFISTTNSTALELSSVFSNTISNNLTIGATIVRDDRDPLGQEFPTVFLEDGNGGVTFGAERFSTANLLNQDVFTINNDLTIFKGAHTLLAGVNFEYFNAENLFIRNNFGRYQYFDTEEMTGVEQFLAGMPATEYEKSFSQVDNVAGDESSAIAAFKQMLLGVYLQDEWQVSSDLKVTGGLRVDIPIWPTDVPLNEDFNENTIPLIEDEGYDLKGARTGSFISSQILFSPRLSFNYDVSGNKRSQLRGGIGVFTTRIPLVWPGGAYNNYGFNVGEFERNNVAFNPDVQQQPVGVDQDGNLITELDLDEVTPSGQIDLFAENFKLPQILKLNIGFDQKLPGGMIASFEGLYSKNINYMRYENLQLKPSQRSLTDAGGDTRPLYNGVSAGFGDDVIDPQYSGIYLASNTNEGYSYNLSAQLTKPFSNGFTGTVAYSYGDAFSLFDGTSSQNSSQWRGYYSTQGRNNPIPAERSVFAAGHRIMSQMSYEISADKGTNKLGSRTKVSLNLNAQTGDRFSYVIGAANFRFVDDGGFNNTEHFYVPTSMEDIPLVDLEFQGQTYTPEEQWEILDAYINDNDELSSRRGDYTERNSGTNPMEFTADFRLLQDFNVKLANGKVNTLQFSFDIFNFTNLLNPEWGIIRFAPGFNSYNIVNLENNLGFPSGENTSPEYTINEDLILGEDPWEGNIDDAGFRSSRWQMQVGVRYIFQ